ncbi:MAG: amino acid permease, partial [Aridibacter sp.]
FYGILIKRQLANPFQDVRSGLFVSLAEWAAKRVAELPTAQERAWRPNLLIPVEDPSTMRGAFNFVREVANPKGSVKLVGLVGGDEENRELLTVKLPALAQNFREEGVFATATIIDSEEYGKSVLAGMQSLSGAFFRPNVILLPLPNRGDEKREAEIKMIINKSHKSRLGVLLFAEHSKARLGRKKIINVWLRDQSPDWHLSMELGNLDLAILISYQINRDWKGRISMISAIGEAENVAPAKEYLENLIVLARIPDADVLVEHCGLDECIKRTPQADLNVFGLPDNLDFEFMRQMVEKTYSTCIFVRDSGDENALA